MGFLLAGNRLYYGDNLEVLREEVANESVDLIYLDPPFNSNRSYNVLFENKSGEEAKAQIEAFDDTWTWTPEADAEYKRLIRGGAPLHVADAIEAMYRLLGTNDVLAYLVMMTPRLVELHRVLKPTGSLYLHCDPTASHYLKVMLDAIFNPVNFRNEIIWKRTSGHSDATRYGRVHDTVLYYAKDDARAKWNQQYQAYDPQYIEQYYRYEDPDGRRFMSGDISAAGLSGGGYEYEWKGITRIWRVPKERMAELDAEGRIFYTRNGFPRIKRYLDEAKGLPAQDVITDIEPLRSWHKEKLEYPTQKPEALLERFILSSSDEGDVVLDPFCGCGTAVAVAHRLRRKWIGIDVTFLAVDLIRERLSKRLGAEEHADYETGGIPRDMGAANALFERSPFEFERWAVSLVGGHPNERQVGDRGVDGRIRFYLGEDDQEGRILVSVKGGKQVNPGMVRDLLGAVENHRADMGILIMMGQPTRGMTEAANRSGTYKHPVTRRTYPRIQILTIRDLLDDKQPQMPEPIPAYLPADYAGMAQQQSLL